MMRLGLARGWLEGRRRGTRSTRRRDACRASATLALAGVDLQRHGDDSYMGGNEKEGRTQDTAHLPYSYFVVGAGAGVFGAVLVTVGALVVGAVPRA